MEEVCRFYHLEEDLIIRFVNEEWIYPKERDQLGFDEEDLARIHLIQELREDFGVNDEAVPIILHLIDQLNCLKLKIRKNKLFRQLQ